MSHTILVLVYSGPLNIHDARCRDLSGGVPAWSRADSGLDMRAKPAMACRMSESDLREHGDFGRARRSDKVSLIQVAIEHERGRSGTLARLRSSEWTAKSAAAGFRAIFPKIAIFGKS